MLCKHPSVLTADKGQLVLGWAPLMLISCSLRGGGSGKERRCSGEEVGGERRWRGAEGGGGGEERRLEVGGGVSGAEVEIGRRGKRTCPEAAARCVMSSNVSGCVCVCSFVCMCVR